MMKRKGKGPASCAPCSLRRLTCDNEDPCGPCRESGRQCKRFNRRASPATASQQLQRGPNAVSALAEQLLGLYLEPYAWRPDVHFQWLLDLPHKRTESQALANSLLALSTAHMGGQKDDPAMYRDALLLYNRATRKLQKDIASSETATSDLTLAACTALWQYLRTIPIPQPEHLLVHLRGVTEILRLRGANSVRSGFARRLFFTLHNGISGVAIMRGEDSILADPEWIEVTLSEEDGDNIRPYDRHKLVNLARLARVKSQFNTLIATSPLGAPARAVEWTSIIHNAWNLLAATSRLIRLWPGRPLRSVPTVLPITTSAAQSPFPESYVFDNPQTAIELSHASINMSSLYNLLWQAYEALIVLPDQSCASAAPIFLCDLTQPSKHAYKAGTLSRANIVDQVTHCKATAQRLACQSCMSVQHSIDDDSSYFGRILVLYPLHHGRRIFSDLLPGTAEQLEWCIAAHLLLSSGPSASSPPDGASPAERTTVTSLKKFQSRGVHIKGLWNAS